MRETGVFLKVERRPAAYRPTGERVRDYRDVAVPRSEEETQTQASRCMNCFLPFCHWTCPLGNDIPEWNGALAVGAWEKAFRTLQATNNLPEVTARICPALCEYGCVLGRDIGAVTIRENELAIIEHAFQSGWVQPRRPAQRTGQSVAVVGSGPAGLACADQLNQAGHRVVVFERDAQPGGILRYGIPDFKLEKWVLDRRLAVWRAEGIEYAAGVAVGTGYPPAKLLKEFDAVCLTGGCRVPRDMPIEGRPLRGIHYAMEYLTQSNRRVAGAATSSAPAIDARHRRVVVIGGGDTGADCVGTAHRQGAASVTQLEILPRPPERRAPGDLWPDYPQILRTSTSHEEGGRREWSVQTQRFVGRDGQVQSLECVRVEWVTAPGQARPSSRELPGTAFHVDADLVLLAMGFVAPERQPLLEALGVALDARGNVQTDTQYRTTVPRIFAAGDMRRGQSLVVWALSEGRRAAHHIDRELTGRSRLPLL